MPAETKSKKPERASFSASREHENRTPSAVGSRSEEIEVDVMIQGISPLQMHRFSDAALAQMQMGTSKVMAGEKPSPAVAAEAVGYFDADGKPYLPNENIFQCLVGAGQHIKYGKSKLTTAKTSKIPAIIDIEEDRVMVMRRNEVNGGFTHANWEPQCFTPTNAMGGKTASWRPVFFEWYIPFVMKIDTASMDLTTARHLVDCAGKWEGLGPQRPARKGRYGRFVVCQWNPKPNLGSL